MFKTVTIISFDPNIDGDLGTHRWFIQNTCPDIHFLWILNIRLSHPSTPVSAVSFIYFFLYMIFRRNTNRESLLKPNRMLWSISKRRAKSNSKDIYLIGERTYEIKFLEIMELVAFFITTVTLSIKLSCLNLTEPQWRRHNIYKLLLTHRNESPEWLSNTTF